jgi:DNA sulfur modification protein DndD
MILSTLKMHNFGVYNGMQSFDFSPDDQGHTVIVVGALNGSGKTTLLTAIQLVLYGPLSPNAKSGKGSYEDYLRNKINRASDAKDGASVQLDFTVFDDDGERRYSIKRFWKETSRGKIKEELIVIVDGELNKFLIKNWAEHIEALLPARIMPLFFFDGEKIEELADEESASAILESAVKGLLGLDLVDQLTSDLGIFELRKKKLLASDEERLRIEGTQEELENHEKTRDQLLQERGAIVARQDRQNSRHDEVSSEYLAQGGEVYEAREELKLNRTEAASQFDDYAEELARTAEGAAPFMLVRELLDSVTLQSDLEEVSEKAEVVLELLTVHDRKTLGKLSELGVGDECLEKVSSYFKSESQVREKATTQECYLNLSGKGREKLHTLNLTVLEDTGNRIVDGLEEVAERAGQVDHFEKMLLAIPESDVIAPFHVAVEESERKLLDFQDQIRFVDIKIHDVDLKIGSVNRELRHIMSDEVDARIEAEDTQRFLKHSSKVKNTLALFRKRTLSKKLCQLEGMILECFEELTRKSRLVSKITINPDTFRMHLKDGDEREILTADLSSGERQLLATSILWGLSKASQRHIPAIIDTPLGRLDSTHREALCERYFPKASHQVILLSTDEEVDEKYLEILRPSINKTFRIDFDADKGGSAVLDGYLF